MPARSWTINSHIPLLTAGSTLDSIIKGVLYPRAATLGGCTAHNALVSIYPDQNDFQYIANLSSQSPDQNYDEFGFGGLVNFRGYFPGYSINATAQHNTWTWALLESHPRNTAGTVELVSANPLDPPRITFNYVCYLLT